jgi:hypothetical protein
MNWELKGCPGFTKCMERECIRKSLKRDRRISLLISLRSAVKVTSILLP